MKYKHLLFKDTRATRDYMRDKRAGTLNGRRWKDYVTTNEQGGDGGSIVDSNFKVENQKPTKAKFPDNMNEAQLLQEIAKTERRINSALKASDSALNNSSWREFNETVEAFPYGVGSSAITPRYTRMVERAMNAAIKSTAANERAKDLTRSLDSYKRAYETVKGSGLLVHEAKTAKRIVGGNLDGKWTKSKNAGHDGTFGELSGQVNGDFGVAKAWGSYRVYRNGREIGSFSKATEAKKFVEKYAKKKR